MAHQVLQKAQLLLALLRRRFVRSLRRRIGRVPRPCCLASRHATARHKFGVLLARVLAAVAITVKHLLALVSHGLQHASGRVAAGEQRVMCWWGMLFPYQQRVRKCGGSTSSWHRMARPQRRDISHRPTAAPHLVPGLHALLHAGGSVAQIQCQYRRRRQQKCCSVRKDSCQLEGLERARGAAGKGAALVQAHLPLQSRPPPPPAGVPGGQEASRRWAAAGSAIA